MADYTTNKKGTHIVRINISCVFVDDQDKALAFYTEVLGFVKKHEVPLGDHRWLTVVAPDDLDGHELLLEADAHQAAKQFTPTHRRNRGPSLCVDLRCERSR